MSIQNAPAPANPQSRHEGAARIIEEIRERIATLVSDYMQHVGGRKSR